MALETLKDIPTLGNTLFMTNEDRPVGSNGEVDWGFFDKLRKKYPICIDHEKNMISFKLQNGPIKEVGKNGCQVTDMIAVAKYIIQKLNDNYPCRENAMTITKLDEALMWQEKRTKDREDRKVEGYNKA